MVFRELEDKALFTIHSEIMSKDEVRLMQKVVDNGVTKAYVFHDRVFVDMAESERVCLMHHTNFISNS